MLNTKRTTVGSRHAMFTQLVYALRDDAQLPAPLARWWLGEANKLSEEPKEDSDLDRLVNSIYGEIG